MRRTPDRASNQKAIISTTKSKSKNELTHPVVADRILRKSKRGVGGKPCAHKTSVRRSRDLARNRIQHRKAGEWNPPGNKTGAAKEKSGSTLLAGKQKWGETEIRLASSQQNRDEARPSGKEKSWRQKPDLDAEASTWAGNRARDLLSDRSTKRETRNRLARLLVGPNRGGPGERPDLTGSGRDREPRRSSGKNETLNHETKNRAANTSWSSDRNRNYLNPATPNQNGGKHTAQTRSKTNPFN
jgi:hypothetical protein